MHTPHHTAEPDLLSKSLFDSAFSDKDRYLFRLTEATKFLSNWLPTQPNVYCLFGSGINGDLNILSEQKELNFSDIPGFPTTSVDGHVGKFVYGVIDGQTILIQQGRLHLYEGFAAYDAVFPTRVVANLGVKRFILTNAVGSLDLNLEPGSIVVLSNILAGQMPEPFVGMSHNSLGTLFSDCTTPFDEAWSLVVQKILENHDISTSRGTFAWMMGPRYDSAAEIADLQARAYIISNVLKKPHLAPCVIGMSMAPEVVALNHLGNNKVIGLSFVSNYAAGVSSDPLSHEQVLAFGREFSVKFIPALGDVLRTKN